ncbi:small acid-soluble spore protein-like protein [Geobacillus thermodenitrificans NG80-2]|nr:small acid-soluble spore protein-like protein [Geobacillus thermodenitrificans NG80-2]
MFVPTICTHKHTRLSHNKNTCWPSQHEHSIKGECAVRNKEHNFPNQNNNKFEGEPRAKSEYASKRADGTTNTHPQERMRASGERSDFF